MFTEAISHARTYAERLQSFPEPADSEVASEIVLRLRQLKWLYDRIQQLERSLISEFEQKHGRLEPNHNVVLAYLNRGIPPDASASFRPQEELRLMGESFYYSAHRILVILDQSQVSLPGLKPINAEEIRRVRNNLVEHANKKGGHPVYTFSVSNADGLRLRTVSRPSDPEAYLDEGIHTNARRFLRELQAVLEAAMETKPGRVGAA